MALAALDRGGTLARRRHPPERHPAARLRSGTCSRSSTLTSVTANTRADGEELLRLAPRLGVDVHVTEYPFDRVDQALSDLAQDRLSGSAVITGYPGGVGLT